MEAVSGWRRGVLDLPPNIFAAVMATGIVSIAVDGAGYGIAARILFAINLVLYPTLVAMLLLRSWIARQKVVADLCDHAKAPGFFTTVAGPCILGNQFLLLADWPAAATVLLAVGLVHWVGLTYVMLPNLMTAEVKPPPERGLSGAWLLVVVGTQAPSVLISLLVLRLEPPPEWIIFSALTFWLAGSMIYLWIISQIFNRILFLPLAANDLTPPYWINMGAMAIATLAGSRLVGLASHSKLLESLLPFLQGMTLLFWATATWWIPVLLALGIWRHLTRHFPLAYDHGYWAAVFPLGMYTVCTKTMIAALELPYLAPIADVFVWVALSAWVVTFAGLLNRTRIVLLR